MDRSYLKAWRIFLDKTSNVPKMVEDLLQTNSTALDCFSALRALSATRFAAPELREKLVDAAVTKSRERGSLWHNEGDAVQTTIDLQAAIDGIVGLTSCSYQPKQAQAFVNQISADLLSKQDLLNFRQKVELLSALTTLSARQDSVSDSVVALVEKLVNEVNTVNYQVIVDDLFHSEITQLHQVYVDL